MKQGMTVQALVDEVDRINRTKLDLVADTRSLMLATEPGVDAGQTAPISSLTVVGRDEEFEVLDRTHKDIAGYCSIPLPFYQRIRQGYPELLDRNVNTLLHGEPARRMIRTIDGKARALLSDKYRRLDNFDLMAHIVPALNATIGGAVDAHVESCGLTDERLWLTVIFPMFQDEIRVGDAVKLGVRIRNSEVGSGRLLVETILYRLICKNGMTTGHELKRTHLGRRVEADEDLSIYSDETLRLDDAAFFAKAADAVRACASEARFQQIVREMKELAGIKIEGEPIEAVKTLSNRVGLTEDESAGMLRHLIEGGDLSGWGYVNALTRAAQDVESYDRSMELESIGGRLAAGTLVEALA